MPSPALAAGFAHDPGADLDDEPGFVGQRNEAVRRHDAALRMLPAQQRLDAGRAAGHAIQDGLVVQEQLAALHGVPQVRFQHQLLGRAGAHFARVVTHAVAAGALRAGHRRLGIHDQGLRVVAVVRRHRHADRSGQEQFETVLDDRGGEGIHQPLRKCRRERTRGAGRREHAEAVAAQAGDHGAVAGALDQPAHRFAQHRVARLVTEAGVDAQEAVDIDHHQRRVTGFDAAAGGVEPVVDLRAQQGLVGQCRQRVEEGQRVDACVRGLHRAPCFDATQLAFDHRHQAGDIALLDVVGDAVAHGREGHVVGNLAGVDDEGNVAPAAAHDFKRGGRIEAGHGVVGNDQIPLALFQRAGEIAGAVHALRIRVQPARAQLSVQQEDVVFIVLDHQYLDGSEPSHLVRVTVHPLHSGS